MSSPPFEPTHPGWKSIKDFANRLGATITMLFLACLPVFSQSSQGAVQGAVFDQSGGAVANAAVSVVDVARGVTRALLTDDAGQYFATNLNPGTYTIRAEAKGFRTVEHSGGLVEVGQNVRVDLILQPGEQTQTITVTAEIPAINTTDATLGGTIRNQTINALPLNGRNFAWLIRLGPRVSTLIARKPGTTSTSRTDLRNVTGVVDGIRRICAGGGLSRTVVGFAPTGDGSSLLPIDAVPECNTEELRKA